MSTGNQRRHLTRRDFLGALGAGATLMGAGGCTSASGEPGVEQESAALEASMAPHQQGDGFARAMRQMFVLDPHVLYMNVGTVGSPPREVLDAYAEANRDVARRALSSYDTAFEGVRQRAAAAYGCDLDELCIAHDTSDAMSKIVAGLDLQPGDEILTTNHEHAAAECPLALLRDRRGIGFRRVSLPVGNDQRAEDYVDRFRAAISPSTKVLLFSAPTYRTGTMLPIRMLSELAQEHGLTTVVDGAHLPGMMRVDLHGWGIDFFAGAGGKWQCGPAGTGILYARNKVLAEYNPRPLPMFWPVITSSYLGNLPPRSTSRTSSYDIGEILQGIGNDSIAAFTAFDRAVSLWDRIGRARIEAHALGLSAYLKERIAERWSVGALVSPKDDPRLASALTAFDPMGPGAGEQQFASLVDALRDQARIVVRYTSFADDGPGPVRHAIRVSTHLFHTHDDVDRVVSALWDLTHR